MLQHIDFIEIAIQIVQAVQAVQALFYLHVHAYTRARTRKGLVQISLDSLDSLDS